MAKTYTFPELNKNVNLPGYNSLARLSESLRDGTDWQTVLSLTIVAEDAAGLKVLTSIRREDTNLTHPGVVSTHTGRLPKSVARQIIQEKASVFGAVPDPAWAVNEVHARRPATIASLSPELSLVPDHESVLPYTVGSLLASKLSLAQLLEQASVEKPAATVSLGKILGGFSYVGDRGDEPLWEPLLMLGAVVNLLDPKAIPATSEAYRDNGWVGLDDYQKGYETTRADLLIPELSPEDQATVCVRGLCLATSNANMSERAWFMTHVADSHNAK